MKLIVVLKGRGANDIYVPVHLADDVEEGQVTKSLCGFVTSENRGWTVIDDVPENRSEHIDRRRKHVCYLCARVVNRRMNEHGTEESPVAKALAREKARWDKFTGGQQPFPYTVDDFEVKRRRRKVKAKIETPEATEKRIKEVHL